MAKEIPMIVRSLSNEYSPQFCYFLHHITNTDLLGRMTRIINYETKRHGIKQDFSVEDFVNNLKDTGDRLNVLIYGDLAEELHITDVNDNEKASTRLQRDEINKQPRERCVAVLTADFTEKEINFNEISRFFSGMCKDHRHYLRHPVFVIKTDVEESSVKDICAEYAKKNQFIEDLDKDKHVIIIKPRSKSTRVAGIPAISVSELGERSRSSKKEKIVNMGEKVIVEEKAWVRKSERLRTSSGSQMEVDSSCWPEQTTKSKSPLMSSPRSPGKSPRRVTHDHDSSRSPSMPTKKRHIETTKPEVMSSNEPTANAAETGKEGQFNVPFDFARMGIDSAPSSPMSVSASGSQVASSKVSSTLRVASGTESIASTKETIDSAAKAVEIKAAISNQFQNNMIDKFEEIEKYILKVKDQRDSKPGYAKEDDRVLSPLDKLIFEIQSLLRLSTTKRGEGRKQNQRPHISYDLVKQLLRMKHVVACGHIYGIFNVHVDGEIPEAVREDVRENVKRFLQENKYNEKCVFSHIKSSNQLGQILISCP